MKIQTTGKPNGLIFCVCCLIVCASLAVWTYRGDNFSLRVAQVVNLFPPRPAIGHANRNDTSYRPMPGIQSEVSFDEASKHTPVSTTSGVKKILVWTPFFAYPSWEKPFGHDQFHNYLCHYNNCITTNDKRYQDSADIVLFHCRNDFKQWPINRQPQQIYAVYCVESPTHSSLKKFNNKMNMTATYRLDSDLPTPYFKMVPRPDPVQKYVLNYSFAGRKKQVIWVSSNCRASSKRQEYVKELSKYISVDIWGGCGGNKCPRSQKEECFRTFSRDYKFYLSFENSICKDYVTDKLLAPMMYGEIVEVALGAGDYSKHVPNGSYIDVRDYKSPKELAEYLHTVSENQTLFENYLQWRATHKVVVANRDKLWCDLCKTANEGTYHKIPEDIDTWWSNGTCDNSLVPKMKQYWG